MVDMPDLPEGPVTVMFTDIEASTALRTSLGDAAADALFAQHDDLVRAQIAEHRGHDLHASLGDGFLAVFVSTRRAIACAIGIQQALDEFNGKLAGSPLKVRVGLNTGEVAWQGENISGEAVHAAARVCAAASGGEVLVSDITRQLAGTVPDVGFVDRGEFALKGFPQPWRLWALEWRRARPTAPQEVFVGREAELAELRKHLQSALDGRGGVVLVGGEPGVGKTTLVKQLIKEAEQKGAIALFGRCYESEGTVPYSPFVETTEQALRVVPEEWVREDLGDDAAEVARMVPELRRRFPDIPDPLDLPPEQQRRYFFNAITGFMARGTERLPVVLVADDVHWADEPTLLLVEHVASVIGNLRLLAIGTYRDVELDVSRPLAATLERLLRNRAASRVAVKRFDRTGVARILEAHLGRSAPDTLVDAVYSETEGNPFFVDEVFRHLLEEGKVLDEHGEFRSSVEIGELEVPESVRLVVGRRVERLGPDAKRVLAAAAVVGRGFEFALLERIAGIDTPTLLDVIDQAEQARVIVGEERGGQVFYTFGHELIRQTLLASLSFPRRQHLHLAVADAMEAIDPSAAETKPSEIAHHLLQAGAAADVGRTVAFLKRAAERAFEAAAFEDAVRSADSALALLPAGQERTRIELLELMGWAERALGHFERCTAIWDEVVDAYAAIGEVEPAGRLLWEMGYVLIWLGRFEDAVAAYARGLAIVGERDVTERAALLGGLATIMAFSGAVGTADGEFDEALRIARAVGDERDLGRIYWGRSVAQWSHSAPGDAMASGQLAVEHLRKAGDMWTLVDALGWLSFPMVMRGEPELGRAAALEGVELGRRVGHQAGEILAQRAVNFSAGLFGSALAELIALAQEDLRRMQSIDSPWVSQSHSWVGILSTLAGDPDHGLHDLELGVDHELSSAWTGVGASLLFLNRALAGDSARCRVLLDEHLPAALQPTDSSSGATMSRLALTEGCALLGWTTELEQLYPLTVDAAEVFPIRPFDLVSGQRVLAMAAAALGRRDDAARHYEAALADVESRPNRIDEPPVKHRYAQFLLAGGGPSERARARELLTAAVDGYRRLGIELLRPEAERLLESLG